MSSPEWKFPLNLAIAFHVLVALAVVYLPHLLKSKPKFEDVYTVNLINIADVVPAEAPPAQAPPKPETAPAPTPAKPIAKTPVKKVAEKAIALEEPEIVEPTPVAPPAPPEAISIKPSRRKVKAEVVPPPPEPPPQKKVEKKDFSKSHRQQLAEMIRAEQKAAEEASILAEEAEIEKRLAEDALNRARAEAASRPSTTSTDQSAPRNAGKPSNQQPVLEGRYLVSITARLQALWSLPEYKKWDPSLSTMVVITVLKNGEIADSFIEVQSGDKFFDRFVTKVLQDVGQLPPIPPSLKLERMEIEITFTPAGIH